VNIAFAIHKIVIIF